MATVLLVDDDPQMTRITARILQKTGFEVSTTNRSFGVLNLVAEVRPDAVVLDINMPGLKGVELLELLRADAELAETRVVFYSGVLQHELEALAVTCRADGHLHKTANLTDLAKLLRSVLAPREPADAGARESACAD